MPQRYFVTRHKGAVTWAARQGLRARKIEMSDFDPSVVRPGDVVIGTLPIHLVAELNRLGGHYWHLTLDIPPGWRGRELSADDMDACGARLTEFRTLELGSRTEVMGAPEVWADHAEAGQLPAIHLCIATGQQLPNAVAIRLCDWDRVAIFASPRMRESASKLSAFVVDEAIRRGKSDASAKALEFKLPEAGDLPSTRAAVQAAVIDLRQQFPAHQLVLNISGGLKLMTIGFMDVLRAQAKILYCDADRGVLEALEPGGLPHLPLGPELDFESYVRVQGFGVVSGGIPDAQRRQQMLDRSSLTATLALAMPRLDASLRAISQGQPSAGLAATIHKLAADAVDSARSGRFEPMWNARLVEGLPVSSAGVALLHQLKASGLLVSRIEADARASELTLYFSDERAAAYLAGGYLEEFAWLSASAAGLPDKHIGLNAYLDPIHRRAGRRGDALNEIDVGVTWNARMLIMECKAGRQLSAGDRAQPILNKAVAVRNGIGGSQARSWIVANTPLPQSQAADIGERAKVGQVELRIGDGDLARLPLTIWEWAGLGGEKPSIDWRKMVLPLTANKPSQKKRKR